MGLVYLILTLALVASVIGAINLGSVDISPENIFRIIVGKIFRQNLRGEFPPNQISIVWKLRFPKVLVAGFTGAGLALAGIMMQALTRNPLADPYILGISSGASTGAVLSLLIGFGAKDLISDVIAGLFIIFEGVYKIGDFVTLGDWFGTIEEIGLRYTKIGWFSETRIINNSSIRDIINTDGDVSREILRVRVPYETDLLEIEKMLNRELPKMAKDIPGLVKPPEYQGINSFEDSYIMLRLAIFCIPWQRRRALREFQRQIKLLFDREGIKMPYSKVIVKEFKEEENDYKFNPENELENETEAETEEK